MRNWFMELSTNDFKLTKFEETESFDLKKLGSRHSKMNVTVDLVKLRQEMHARYMQQTRQEELFQKLGSLIELDPYRRTCFRIKNVILRWWKAKVAVWSVVSENDLPGLFRKRINHNESRRTFILDLREWPILRDTGEIPLELHSEINHEYQKIDPSTVRGAHFLTDFEYHKSLAKDGRERFEEEARDYLKKLPQKRVEPKPTVQIPSSPKMCKAKTTRKKGCKRLAKKDGYCTFHAPK
jgi:hypothetical protein